MFGSMLENVRMKNPLIHNITNYVTVNDCANILLACGASPIMSDDKDEVEEITSICNALNINIGTLNENTIKSMFIAGEKANELGHHVIFDPVGVGASILRMETSIKLLKNIKFSVIRGNISEIKALYYGSGKTKGVDANIEDVVTEKNLDEIVSFAKKFSKDTGAIIVITGPIDIVADHKSAYCIRNGKAMMSSITGTGCQLSAVIAAFVSANNDNLLEAVAAAVVLMGYAGEIAYNRLNNMDGNSTYRNYIIDAVYNMSQDMLNNGAKYEIR